MDLLKKLAIVGGVTLGVLSLSEDADACHTCSLKPHVSSHTTIQKTRVYENYYSRTEVTRTVDRHIDNYGNRSRHVSVDVRKTPRPVYVVPTQIAVPVVVPIPVYPRPVFGYGIHPPVHFNPPHPIMIHTPPVDRKTIIINNSPGAKVYAP